MTITRSECDDDRNGGDARLPTREDVQKLFDLRFLDLLVKASSIHRDNHQSSKVQLATLLSIKTGGCAEDCGYCSQSASAISGVRAGKLVSAETVLEAARTAKAGGSRRFCMGAA